MQVRKSLDPYDHSALGNGSNKGKRENMKRYNLWLSLLSLATGTHTTEICIYTRTGTVALTFLWNIHPLYPQGFLRELPLHYLPSDLWVGIPTMPTRNMSQRSAHVVMVVCLNKKTFACSLLYWLNIVLYCFLASLLHSRVFSYIQT